MKNNFFLSVSWSILFLAESAFSQTPSLVVDINQATLVPVITNNSTLISNNLLCFSAQDNTDYHLWRTDGTSNGTFNTGVEGSFDNTIDAGGAIYGHVNGQILKTNGTPEGTLILKDYDLTASYFAQLNGLVFFNGSDPAHGSELWKTDGTPEGTIFLKDFDNTTSNSYPLNHFVVLNNKLIFTCLFETGIFSTDGTESGTYKITDINVGNYTAINNLVTLNNKVFFVASSESSSSLWKSDGTETGTEQVYVFDTQKSSKALSEIVVANNMLFMIAHDQLHGDELWTSDGTTAGTQLVSDISPGSAGAFDANAKLWPVGNEIYFYANDGVHGNEPWHSDGTEAGTLMIADLQPGDEKSNSDATNFMAFNGSVIFSAFPEKKVQSLYLTDGTEATTSVITIAIPSNPVSRFINYNAKIYFSINDLHQLWSTDGTAEGTAQFLSSDNQTQSSYFNAMQKFAPGKYLITGADAISNATFKIFASDGTTAGTTDITLTYPFAAGLSLFSSGINGKGLYVAGSACCPPKDYIYATDGTQSGTILLDSVYTAHYESGTVLMNNILYFLATKNAANDYELWRTDGTPEGTDQVANINPNAYDNIGYLTLYNDELFFNAQDQTHGRELWKSDGTAQGTVLVKDIRTGAESSEPAYLTVLNNKLYFAATDASHGTELWVSDGTSTGTYMLKDIYPGNKSSNPYSLKRSGDYIFFSAEDDVHGVELWRTDGTSEGTMLVKDISPGKADGYYALLADVNGTLFFTDENTLFHVTGADTVVYPVKYLSGSNIFNRAVVGNDLYYVTFPNLTANSDTLWRTDGTACHTQPLVYFPSLQYIYQNILLVDSNVLFLALTSPPYGKEPMKLITEPIPTIEICNGFDDDCDGLIDEDGVTVSISTDDPLVLCEGDPITLTASGENISSYQWYKNGSPVAGATNNSFTAFYGKTYYVVAGQNGGCIETSNVITVQRKARPHAMITVLDSGNLDICLGEVELQSNPGNDLTWQWLLNGEPIAGATNQNYIPAVPGNYRVKVFKSNGCASSSQKVVVTSSCKNAGGSEAGSILDVYPNPTSSNSIIEIKMETDVDVTIELMDVSGRKLRNIFNGLLSEGDHRLNFDRENLISGVYILQLKSGAGIFTSRLVIE